MSNVIEFLERLGQDATLRHATRDQVKNALESVSIDEESKSFILDGDCGGLGALLGAKDKLCCMVYPVDSTH